MQETVAHLPRVEFDGVVDLLGERKNRIWLLGGRLTDPLAAYLCHHLKVVRADVVHLRGVPSSWADSLVDMGKHDVLVIFDIRRYWDGALHIAEMAAQRKVSVLLFTDQWLSPVSRVARFTLAAHTAGPSGWDTNTPLMLLVDAVIAALNTRQWAAISDRLQEVKPCAPGWARAATGLTSDKAGAATKIARFSLICLTGPVPCRLLILFPKSIK